MGLFDIASGLITATAKVALTPIAVAKDAVSVVTGQEPDATKDLLKSAGDDLEKVKDQIDPLA